MENVEKIESLLKTAKAIRDGFKEIDNSIKDSLCDWMGVGFNKDDRFSACSPIKISVDSWKGHNGNSGCSRIFSFNDNVFNKYFIEVLNNHFNNLLEETAENIEKEAAKLKNEAIKELENKINSFKSLE